jgi:hypothetical protein
VVRSFEYGNECSVSIKGGEFLDHVSSQEGVCSIKLIS